MRAITLMGYQLIQGTQPGAEPPIPSIKCPDGANVINFFMVTPDGVRKDPNTEIFANIAYTFDPPGQGQRRWVELAGGGGPGEPDFTVGGIVGGEPGDVNPDVSVHWDFEQADTAGTGTSGTVPDLSGPVEVARPIGDAYFKPTFRIGKGNPTGVWVAIVAAATDADGNSLDFDLSTKA
jgi:hypothetical protein